MSSPNNMILVLGPTASGKTRLAVNLASMLDTEVISIDSRQVFRGMDIGTGKDLQAYRIGDAPIPHHLIDIADAGSDYHLDQYVQDFFQAYANVAGRNKIPIACGGSPLYIDAVLKGYGFTSVPVDPTLRAALEAKDREELLRIFHAMPHTAFTPVADTSTAKRLIRAIEINTYLEKHDHQPRTYPKLTPLVFGLQADLPFRRERIRQRLNERMAEGLEEEVRMLMEKIPAEKLIRYGLEYKFVVRYLQGELTRVEMTEQLEIAIRQFAKRQMTFFRKMEKEGLSIHWIDASLNLKEQLDLCLSLIDH